MITAQGVAVPEDMAQALSADADGVSAFEALRPDDQRVYVDWITKAAGKDQRAERLQGLTDHVRAYQRRPAEEHGSPHPLVNS